MKTRRLFALATASLIVTLGLSPMPAPAGITGQWISYAAKFVCGPQNGAPEQPVANGLYKTVVNIHNPHYLTDVGPVPIPIPVLFYKKIVLALPQGEIPLKPSCKLQEVLEADHALGVNCGNIIQQLQLSGVPIPPNPREGYVVIEVPPQVQIIGGPLIAPELDVTTVYTARHRTGIAADVTDYDVQTWEVEDVDPRTIIGQPDANPCPPDGPDSSDQWPR